MAGFAAIGGAVALDANATASPTNVPTTVPTTVDTTVDGGTAPQQQTWQPDAQSRAERQNDQSSGPIAGSSGAPSPDTSSHGS